MQIKDKHPTTLTFFRFEGLPGKWSGFVNTGRSKLLLSKVQGLKFGYMLGSGAGSGFSLKPNFSTYALLGHWDHMRAATKFFNEDPFFASLSQSSIEQWTVVMLYTKGHGEWKGIMPFSDPIEYNPNTKIAVITRATIRFKQLLDFWKHVPAVADVTQNVPGNIFSVGVGEWPIIQQATFSIWDNEASLNAFAYQQRTQHSAVIRRTRERNWYKEEMFARFHLIASWGSWGGINPLNPLLSIKKDTHGVES